MQFDSNYEKTKYLLDEATKRIQEILDEYGYVPSWVANAIVEETLGIESYCCTNDTIEFESMD